MPCWYQLVHRPARLGAAVCIRSQQPARRMPGGTLASHSRRVAGLHIGHLFLDHRAPFNEAGVQSLLHQLRPAVQQLGRGGDQLVRGRNTWPLFSL